MGRTSATTGRHAIDVVVYAFDVLIRYCLWVVRSFLLSMKKYLA